jgi:hypothetical protein
MTLRDSPKIANPSSLNHQALRGQISPSDTAIAIYGGRELQPNRGNPLNLDWVNAVRVNTSAVRQGAATDSAGTRTETWHRKPRYQSRCRLRLSYVRRNRAAGDRRQRHSCCRCLHGIPCRSFSLRGTRRGNSALSRSRCRRNRRGHHPCARLRRQMASALR